MTRMESMLSYTRPLAAMVPTMLLIFHWVNGKCLPLRRIDFHLASILTVKIDSQHPVCYIIRFLWVKPCPFAFLAMKIKSMGIAQSHYEQSPLMASWTGLEPVSASLVLYFVGYAVMI